MKPKETRLTFDQWISDLKEAENQVERMKEAGWFTTEMMSRKTGWDRSKCHNRMMRECRAKRAEKKLLMDPETSKMTNFYRLVSEKK